MTDCFPVAIRNGHLVVCNPSLFLRGTNPTQEGSLPITSAPPQGPTSSYHHRGVWVLTCEFGGGDSFRPVLLFSCASSTPTVHPLPLINCIYKVDDFRPYFSGGRQCPLSSVRPRGGQTPKKGALCAQKGPRMGGAAGSSSGDPDPWPPDPLQ